MERTRTIAWPDLESKPDGTASRPGISSIALGLVGLAGLALAAVTADHFWRPGGDPSRLGDPLFFFLVGLNGVALGFGRRLPTPPSAWLARAVAPTLGGLTFAALWLILLLRLTAGPA